MKVEFRKSALWILIIICPAIGILTDAWAAEKYPSKPINVIVGYSAGGITDTVARVSVEAAKGVLGVPMVILNKPGAGSAIGMEILKNAKPDGYTIGVSTTGSLATTRLGAHRQFSRNSSKTFFGTGVDLKLRILLRLRIASRISMLSSLSHF